MRDARAAFLTDALAESMHTLSSRRSVFAALLMVGMAACSHPVASGSAPSDRPNRNVLTESELPENGAETIYDVVQRLRPEYLRRPPSQLTNGKGNAQPSAAVFANGQLLGTIEDLRRIPISSVKLIRHYSVEEGKQRFGMQYGGGIIELTYRM